MSMSQFYIPYPILCDCSLCLRPHHSSVRAVFLCGLDCSLKTGVTHCVAPRRFRGPYLPGPPAPVLSRRPCRRRIPSPSTPSRPRTCRSTMSRSATYWTPAPSIWASAGPPNSRSPAPALARATPSGRQVAGCLRTLRRVVSARTRTHVAPSCLVGNGDAVHFLLGRGGGTGFPRVLGKRAAAPPPPPRPPNGEGGAGGVSSEGGWVGLRSGVASRLRTAPQGPSPFPLPPSHVSVCL